MLPQELKSEAHRNLQPKNMNKSSVQLIMAYDLAGWRQKDIAEMLNMTQPRVCIIMNSPLYLKTKKQRFLELQEQVLEGKSQEALKGDPVRQLLKAKALQMAETKLSLAETSKNDYVRNSIATDWLDRCGYAPEKNSTKLTVEVTEKMASRFDRVLGRTTTKKLTMEI